MLNKFIPFFLVIFINISVFSQENPLFPSQKPDFNTSIISHSSADTNVYLQGVWSYLAELPSKRYGTNTYYDSAGGRIFICGGRGENALPTDTCWWYNINSNSYQQAASLPEGRWSGKLVKVKNFLYLVGSINTDFTAPDGLIFKYSLLQNTWSIADTLPAPFVHEPAVCVINDSLIAVIGGSTSGFLFPVNRVRIYEPELNTWIGTNLFPVNLTTSHAEYLRMENDSLIFVFGGYNAGNLNSVYKGRIENDTIPDSIKIVWELFGSTPYGIGTYRVAGSRWKDYMLIGPAMNGGVTINSIWGLNYSNSIGVWTNFQPSSADSAGIISTFASVTGIDSNYFYLFGGLRNPNALNTAKKYSFITPPPIGIVNINGNVPGNFILHQNFPNPFNPETKIIFDVKDVSADRKIFFKVYDITGRVVTENIFENIKPGKYQITFKGNELASGVYFYSIYNNFQILTKKMILLK